MRLQTATVPVVHVRVPVLKTSVPELGAWVTQARWAAQSNLPPPDRLLYYSGLGVLAAAGILEWPVAAVVGAGVWVAGRTGRGRVTRAREA